MPLWPLLATSFLENRDDLTHWVIISVGVLATLYLIMRPKTKGRDPMAGRPAFGVSEQRQVERDMNALMVEMLETARQMAAQLETRAARMEVLIRQADQRIATLRGLEAKRGEGRAAGVPAGDGNGAYGAGDGNGRPGDRASGHATEPVRADATARTGEASGTAGTADPAGDGDEPRTPQDGRAAGQDEAGAEEHAGEAPETPPDPRHAEVYALADGGCTPREISLKLNRPSGEVELILALRAR